MGRWWKKAPGWLPLGLGVLLWGTSAVLTLSLFLSLSGDSWWQQGIAAAWVVGLEGTKIQSWRIGGAYRWLALCLVGVTLFSVWGLAVGTVEVEIEKSLVTQQEASQSFRDARRSIEDLQTQISVLVRRLATMPEDFVTATNQLNQEILKLRERLEGERTLLATQSPGDQQSRMATDPFTVLATAWGWSRRNVVILVLLIVAGLTEASALAMVGYRPPIVAHGHQDRTQSVGVLTEMEYLKAALDHPNHPTYSGPHCQYMNLALPKLA